MARIQSRSLMCQTIKDNQFLVFFILAITALAEGIFEIVRQKKISNNDLTLTARIAIYVGIALFGLAALLLFLYREFCQLRNFGYDMMMPLNLPLASYPQRVHTSDSIQFKLSEPIDYQTGTSPMNTRRLIEVQEQIESLAKTPPDQQAAALSDRDLNPLHTQESTVDTFNQQAPLLASGHSARKFLAGLNNDRRASTPTSAFRTHLRIHPSSHLVAAETQPSSDNLALHDDAPSPS